MRYHFTPVRVTIIKKSIHNKCWREYGGKGALLHCRWEGKLVQPLRRTPWRFPKNLKVELSYDPAVPLLSKYLRKNVIQRDTRTPGSPAAPFTAARTWTEPNCPSTDEWVKKIRSVYIYIYIHMAVKKKEVSLFVAAWMALEIHCPTANK